ncbi:MAG: 1-deoxy-D-xylulose-5-phosphate reductoisomerase [Bifidobacterium scardovii]|uniref:1-deoxy-D-xylulose-5-phosphate reductoisomerase n=1 Tax=Bifidobacterium scardovii TaxID=158787 RepID=UPI000664E28D|nr:1-deoxy-D-xylulose-5-phosphate reductoisomerase [Bifidobacterium scardovii]MBS6947699.1 1-deoxy-D-xylulose-5-phosphate reductoisomerase [Bifidobacterium scardovii]MDU2420989.1 1-deoxy-D-xylulose-5-phosphate reductoisomerase [Bifidobacterium scardovii]MDU3735818.1 1-deoxy-D-xylulose-5-phosphate reductoisomerase [Bifidobacterium scardovii]MDU5297478.1 1-deoxy-D-xylulose-5-phosphate reductoisomerase [Bifidobacterium scardovii]MDU5609821.1 1-deoxy-D-xylulose-5-phosphate reductoisomerase [Bifido
MNRQSTVIILGSTGSIGTQGLDVIARHPERFTVTGLAAGGAHVGLLAEQAARFRVPQVAVYDAAAATPLREALDAAGARNTTVQAGPEAVIAMAGAGADVVLNGITGSIGLEPSIAALQADSQLALANKESVVAGGHLLFDAQTRDNQINPVDSEHSAIWQSLRSGTHGEVSKLIVTASGGPFRGWTRDRMRDITPEQALNHPTWHMGPVVTINSSTLMNKGLEVIEASRLFDVPPDRIDVTVHPQSTVHSMVEFVDGATICQASPPDMRLPIALGLSAPDRLGDVAAACDWTQAATWTFEPLDDEAFPAVSLARHCLAASEKHTAVLNAANEQAVHAFLDRRLPYLGIVDTVKAVLDEMDAELRGDPLFRSVEEMGQVEQEARRRADDLINKQM